MVRLISAISFIYDKLWLTLQVALIKYNLLPLSSQGYMSPNIDRKTHYQKSYNTTRSYEWGCSHPAFVFAVVARKPYKVTCL